MRILCVTPMLPDAGATSAGPVVFFGQLRAMAERHRVELVTLVDEREGPDRALAEIGAIGVRCHVVRRNPPRGFRRAARQASQAALWIRGASPLRTLWFASAAFQETLDRVTADSAFDLIEVEDNAMACYRYPRGPAMLLTENDVRRPSPPRAWKELGPVRFRPLRDALDRAEQRRWDSYQRNAWTKFDRIQVFTKRDAAKMAELAPELAGRIRINPFGTEMPSPAESREEIPGAIVFTGSFLHRPNIDAACWLVRDIMPRLRALYPAVSLSLVGSDPPPEIVAMGAADIEVTGRVPEVRPYLARASVVLAPVRTGGGMRMKVLEAMALGKAVVTTPAGAEGLEFDCDEPPLAMASDAEGLAASTALLLASPAARTRLGSRARDFVSRRFSWQAYSERLEALYAELSCPDAVSQRGMP